MADTQSLSSLTIEDTEALMQSLGQPRFRATQVFGWLHQKRAESFGEMSNLPLSLREALAAGWHIDVPTVRRKQTSRDGTVKYLFELGDGACVEAVLMQYSHGNTLCVSSQVGCRMGCRFCASTQGGLVRNLVAGEIAGQVYAAEKDSGLKVSNIVLMGMGEPLDNYDAVLRFVHIITSPEGANLANRGISLSTCGIVPGIDRLAGEKLQLTLSVSLHAADDAKRSGMMPVNDAYPVAEVIAACRRYKQATGRRISFEYAMVRGVNDTPADAEGLARLLRGLAAHVNLIPVNPVDGSPYGASDEKNIQAFRTRLEGLGLNATVRRRLGADIDAACGQLRQRDAARGK